MHRPLIGTLLLLVCTGVPPTASAQTNACDVNTDGFVNVIDVHSATNQILGLSSCTTADIDGGGHCDIIDLQKIINAAPGGSCIAGSGTGAAWYVSPTGNDANGAHSFTATLSALFVDTTAADYQLSAASPATDKGQTLAAVASDRRRQCQAAGNGVRHRVLRAPLTC